jgi:hypothetical protein
VRIVNGRRPASTPSPAPSDADLAVLLGIGCAGFVATLGGVVLGGIVGFLIGTVGLLVTLTMAGLFGVEAVRALLPPNAS